LISQYSVMISVRDCYAERASTEPTDRLNGVGASGAMPLDKPFYIKLDKIGYSES